jgi:prevent-host-death family protein
MQTLPISKVKDRLNELVDAVSQTHEQVTVTKNGTPAAILVGTAEWEALQETLFWLSQPGVRDDITDARKEFADRRGIGEDEIRAEFASRQTSRE